MTWKGIILAGGSGTRLRPLTNIVCKQLLPVYDKPLIFYPLSTLMLAGIQDILIISDNKNLPLFEDLLGDGSQLGIKLSYSIQAQPNGIAEALLLGEDFAGDDNVCLILGDNIFFGANLYRVLSDAMSNNVGATIVAQKVVDPKAFGVVTLDGDGEVVTLEEKPQKPQSDRAVTGIYFYDNAATSRVKTLEPSERGELEITDLNKSYAADKMLSCVELGRGYSWFDTGTVEGLYEASSFVEVVQRRQGMLVGSPEEIAFVKGWISSAKLRSLSSKYKKSTYGKILNEVCVNGR